MNYNLFPLYVSQYFCRIYFKKNRAVFLRSAAVEVVWAPIEKAVVLAFGAGIDFDSADVCGEFERRVFADCAGENVVDVNHYKLRRVVFYFDVANRVADAAASWFFGFADIFIAFALAFLRFERNFLNVLRFGLRPCVFCA